MALSFPKPEGTMVCPYCRALAGFRVGLTPMDRPNAAVTHFHDDTAVPATYGRAHHEVMVLFCRSCGYAVIKYEIRKPGSRGVRDTIETFVYPVAPRRELAPGLVREEDADLAQDYDEAVHCEPHSLQAAAMLIGRCASHILIDKCDADKTKPLGPQIDDAIAGGTLPDKLAELLKRGLKHARNLSAHEWFDAAGKTIRADSETVDMCFNIVDAMFYEFYVKPHQEQEFFGTMEQAHEEKKQGDKV